jgi:hypothetical protein
VLALPLRFEASGIQKGIWHFPLKPQVILHLLEASGVKELDFKELDFKELGVLGYLLGVLGYLMGVPI